MSEYRTRKRNDGTNQRVRSLRQADNMCEALLWSEFKDRKLGGHKFVRQFPIGPYFADFICRKARLVVEIDGSQHVESEYDRKRDEFMRDEGYSVIRFWNHDVIKNRESVCRTILAAIDKELVHDVVASDLRYVVADDD